MGLDRAYLMLEHSGRQEQRFIDLVKIYQETLGLIATNSALHPNILAQQAIKKAMPIMQEMTNDPWPPVSDAKQGADQNHHQRHHDLNPRFRNRHYNQKRGKPDMNVVR